MHTSVSWEQVHAALQSWAQQPDNTESTAATTRISLTWLAKAHPGKAVELRILPFGVTQILSGAQHRRGTPPAVVEMQADTWLKLLCGQATWDQACASGLVQASGERSNLRDLIQSIVDQI